jgi:hypothetical protein
MKRNLSILIAIFIITLIAGAVVLFVPSNKANAPTNTTEKASIDDLIIVDVPTINAAISSPLTISGKARGYWFFEASFPIELQDAEGKKIAETYAQATEEWMTEEFVPFSLSFSFPAQKPGSKGTLILHKDNPSGEPQHDRSVSIPVTFK